MLNKVEGGKGRGDEGISALSCGESVELSEGSRTFSCIGSREKVGAGDRGHFLPPALCSIHVLFNLIQTFFDRTHLPVYLKTVKIYCAAWSLFYQVALILMKKVLYDILFFYSFSFKWASQIRPLINSALPVLYGENMSKSATLKHNLKINK